MPLALFVSAASLGSVKVTPAGLSLAALSGSVTSALGYAIWYRALRGLSAVQAAVVQLSVPVVAALTAAFLLDERLTVRLIASPRP